MTLPVHGSDFISSPVLFPRNKTGNYDTSLVAPDCVGSRLACAYRSRTGNVEGGPTTGNLAGECCR